MEAKDSSETQGVASQAADGFETMTHEQDNTARPLQNLQEISAEQTALTNCEANSGAGEAAAIASSLDLTMDYPAALQQSDGHQVDSTFASAEGFVMESKTDSVVAIGNEEIVVSHADDDSGPLNTPDIKLVNSMDVSCLPPTPQSCSEKRELVKRRLFAKDKASRSPGAVKRTSKADPGTSGTVEAENPPRKRKRRKKNPLEGQEAEQILENMEGEIDKVLEETAQKNKLTAANVKNILWHVITNQHVLSMVRNTMITEGNCDLSEIEEAEYEPKLTRAKVKELKEKQSDLPWPVTPIKQPVLAPSTQLLAKEFANEESSSDEEYHPANDEETEDEDESLMSPHASDVSSPDVRPTSTPTSCLQQSPQSTDATSIPQTSTSDKEGDGIALRTRSKLPLNDMPLEMIEASFVPPDFTMDMYDSDCDDDEWKNFLSDFCKPLETIETMQEPQDDANDPEYNFLEDEDVLDSWDLRYDKAVKITKKEWNELIAGLLEAAEQVPGGDEEDEEMPPSANASTCQDVGQLVATADEPSSALPLCPHATPSPPIICLSEFERTQLAQHMRMHVQLLTQTYLLGRHTANLKKYSIGAKELLIELKKFSSQETSAFHAHNLDEALDVVATHPITASDAFDEPLRPSRLAVNIMDEDKQVMFRSKVFLYPELLPQQGPRPETYEKGKVRFTSAEDQLIAMGLEQFAPLKDAGSAARLIQSLMVPIKTEQQIQIRIKNVKFNSKITESNPIKFYVKFHVAPLVQPVVKPFSPDAVCPPSSMPQSLLPEWMASLSNGGKRRYQPLVAPKAPLPKQTPSSSSLLRHVRGKARHCPRRKRLILPQTMAATPNKHVSPLKQISPILKKYHKVPANKTNPVPAANAFLQAASTTLTVLPAEAKKTMWKPVLPRPEPTRPSQVSTRRKVKDSATETEPDTLREQPVIAENGRQSDLPDTTNVAESASVAEKSVLGDAMGSADEACCEDVEAEGELGDGEEERVDDEGDLAALMAASSTICKKNPLGMKNKRTAKQKRDVESLLNLIAEDLVESDPLKDERENAYAEMYLLRVKEMLADDQHTYRDFLETLCDFERSGKSVVQLYHDMSRILSAYPELVKDFVMFLLPEQAKECGRLTDYLLLQKMRGFLRKLEVHFSRQPQHIQKILRTLNQLQRQPDLSVSSIRSTFLPLLRGQPHLLEEFLQLLPQERPPDSWMTEFEEVTIPDSDDEQHSDDGFETVTIPDTQDVYGTNICPCQCHMKTSDPRFQNRIRHCVRCGIKFVGGKVYLQTGRRTLKPAQVIYKEKESRKTSSSTDDSAKDVQAACDEDDAAVEDRTGTQRTCEGCCSEHPKSFVDLLDKFSKSKNKTSSVQVSVVPAARTKADEVSVNEVTSTQEDDAISTMTTTVPFTRDEDCVLLQTCQEKGTGSETFEEVARMLKNRSMNEVKERFVTLMRIIEEKSEASEEENECA